MLRPTPGDPRDVEQYHWNTGAKEIQQLNPGGPSNRQKPPATLRIPSKKTIAALFVSSDFPPVVLHERRTTVKFVDFRL